MLSVTIGDIPTQYGMLLSRRWEVAVGGSMKLDNSYTTIPA